MSKRRTTTFAMILAGASLATAAMAAQQGHGGGPPAGVGSGGGHSSMGMPSGQKSGSFGSPNGHSGSNHPASAPLPGPMSPASALDQNSKLAEKLASFFPSGTNLAEQASGFKNLGQFVSAVHVSHNLGIPFADLKCAELGTTAATSASTVCSSAVTNRTGEPLGTAIQQLKPGTNSMHAIQDANGQGEADFYDVKTGAKS
jgi:hypothetical protein